MLGFNLLHIFLAIMGNSGRATDAELRRAAGSQSLEKLLDVMSTGWTADDVNRMGEHDNSKTAMHMAAWKGCLDNVKHLVEIGCDIDVISTSEFSYGKTPIFFASTRNRNDVVDYLLDRGAFVKIVNNKGQSVLSIAASHLSEDVISKIQAKEQEQSGPWLNFRASHSDGFEYGDLDPRFLDRPIRPEDVVTTLAINPTTKQTRKGGFLRRNPGVSTGSPSSSPKHKRKLQVARSLTNEERDGLDIAWKSLISSFHDGTELCDDIMMKAKKNEGVQVHEKVRQQAPTATTSKTAERRKRVVTGYILCCIAIILYTISCLSWIVPISALERRYNNHNGASTVWLPVLKQVLNFDTYLLQFLIPILIGCMVHFVCLHIYLRQ